MKADICFGFSSIDWENLVGRLDGDETAWEKAIGVFETRMKERFFSCIDALVEADAKPDMMPSNSQSEARCIPGFSIMALCCLLVESLQAFQGRTPTTRPAGQCTYPDGSCIKPSPDTTGHFIEFLRRPSFGGVFDEDKIAMSFVRGIRNGILHEAETRKWVIWREEPAHIVEQEQDGYALNRTLFYEAVKKEFDEYLSSLRDPVNGKLRGRFKKKMNDICKES